MAWVSTDNPHLARSIVMYNGVVSPPDGISVESIYFGFPNPTNNFVSEMGGPCMHSFGLYLHGAATDADTARLHICMPCSF